MTDHVYLLGFMGAGKSTVGPLLAKLLSMPFVDSDSRIEEIAGKPVSQIFTEDGEDTFREMERAFLRDIADQPSTVIAVGGGMPVNPENLAAMRKNGTTIGLSVALSEVTKRIHDASTRPLFTGDGASTLYRARQRVYRQVHATVVTDGKQPQQIAQSAAGAVLRLRSLPSQFHSASRLLCLGERSYPIITRRGALEAIADVVRALPGRPIERAVIITDTNVGPLYAGKVSASLAAAGITVSTTEIPAGESEKSLTRVSSLAEELAPIVDRNSLVVALGGGVVGDLAGFVASGMLRGIRVIQVPTTLLAMTDSAIGGKTAVNLACGKNLFGAFWQPVAVVSDPVVLATLPPRERRASLGELVKYGLLDSDELLEKVAELAPGLCGDELAVDEQLLDDVIDRCAGYKVWIVGRDEREGGERAFLNLGHTLGHAIEAEAGYGTVLHGEAVALGLIAACRLAEARGFAAPGLEEQTQSALLAGGVDTDLQPWLTEAVFARLGVDKKRTGTRIQFVVPCAPGHVELHPLTPSEIAITLRT